MFLIALSIFATQSPTVLTQPISQVQIAQESSRASSQRRSASSSKPTSAQKESIPRSSLSRSSIGRSVSSRTRSSSSSGPRQYSSRVYSSSVRSLSSSRGSSVSSILSVSNLKTQEMKTAHPAIENVALEDGKVSVDYRSDAHLFGFIPISMPLHIEVTTNGVKVRKPWWGFLASDKAAVIKASLSATLTGEMGEQAVIQTLMNAFDEAE